MSDQIPTPEWLTERLRIRPWDPHEAESALAIYGDPDVMRWLGGAAPVTTVEEQRERLAKRRERMAQWDDQYGAFALERRTDGLIVGTVLLLPLQNSNPLSDREDIEVGWHLRQDCVGHGYATEAAKVMLRHGFEHWKLSEILAVVMPGNGRSIAVASRIGMKHRGQTDRYYSTMLDWFSISREAWLATQTA